MKKDNAGLKEKLALRRAALEETDGPLVCLEAYAGEGVLGSSLYQEAACGVAIEKDERKATKLCRERPAWRVYQADAVGALAAGLSADVPFTFIDIDPYGDPHPAINAVLAPGRLLAGRVVLAVNDGLRQKVKMGGAWQAKSLRDAVRQFGGDLFDTYIEVCRWLIEKRAGEVGYHLTRFRGFYGGHAQQMTHYYAVLERREDILTQAEGVVHARRRRVPVLG